jgi:hypothetical protein
VWFSEENGSPVVNIRQKRIRFLYTAVNIIRKVVPDDLSKGIEGIVSRPLVLSIG